MMINIPDKIEFFHVKRQNVFAKKGHEWAFNAIIGDTIWNINTWDHEPTIKEINLAKEISLRSMEIYHRSLSIASFTLKEETK